MSEPLTKRDLADLVRALENNRDQALERQTNAIEKLFDTKLGHVSASLLSVSNALSKHVDDDRTEFSRVYAKIEPLQQTMAITKLKLAGVIAAASTIAGAVSAFIVKHFLSVVVYK